MARRRLTLILLLVTVGTLVSCDDSVWWLCARCSFYENNKAVQDFLASDEAANAIARESGDTACDYEDNYYDPVSPVGFDVLSFGYQQPYEFLKTTVADPRILEGQDLIILVSGWHDSFANPGYGLGQFGHDFPSATLVHAIDPATGENWLAWRGKWTEFQAQTGMTWPKVTNSGGTTRALSKTYQVGISGEQLVKYCNPPCWISGTVEDEAGIKKAFRLPLE
jgi:hypothetical protein